ncbi:MAG TPA: Fe-S cluster assembly protein SufD [Rhabdochlamydiaceae bacterium]|jgi:Fe-S cluster assembly protein SufD|nr:Fe-S cluster assembly protein SufD [Rhabdochlamydiaceae bacterium]
MSTEETFLSGLHQYFGQVRGRDLLKGMREKAWDHFLELGLPKKTDEAFRYVPLRRLYELSVKETSYVPSKEEILSYIYPQCRGNYLVFINGAYQQDLSDLSELSKKIVALPIADAMRSYGPFLQSRWSQTLKEEPDPFALLNLAVHPQGLFFYVPPKVVVEKPIQTLFFNTTDFAPARLQLFLAPQTQVQWISTIAGGGIHNIVLDVALEDGASFDQTEAPKKGEGWHLNYFRATLKRDSRLKYFALTQGPRTSRHSIRAHIQGENADLLLQGLWDLQENAHAHTHVFVEHVTPHARSLQKFKGVLKDTSQSSFEGKIFVRPEAQQTEAYQLNHNLLLSEGAIAHAKPNLEIFADDVKASHGATFAQVDDEQLFYLKSRGISTETARQLLIRGYRQEMLSQISPAFIREEVQNGL